MKTPTLFCQHENMKLKTNKYRPETHRVPPDLKPSAPLLQPPANGTREVWWPPSSWSCCWSLLWSLSSCTTWDHVRGWGQVLHPCRPLLLTVLVLAMILTAQTSLWVLQTLMIYDMIPCATIWYPRIQYNMIPCVIIWYYEIQYSMIRYHVLQYDALGQWFSKLFLLCTTWENIDLSECHHDDQH